MTQTSESPPAAGIERLVAALASYANSESKQRGILAALRSGLGKPPGQAVATMAPYVERFFDGDFGAPDEAYLIASLFATHQVHRRNPHFGGFGGDLKAIALRDGHEDPGVARRFGALLDSHRDELPVHLRQLVSLMKASGGTVPIDYVTLYHDLRNWDEADRRVQKKWAKGFWGGRSSPSPGANAATDATTEDDDPDLDQDI